MTTKTTQSGARKQNGVSEDKSVSEVIVHSDGACRGNPGPGGWGAILESDGRVKEINGYKAHTTNNEMEMTAALEALLAIKKPSRVTVVTDSSYLIKGMTEWMSGWKKKGWKTANKKPVKNKGLWVKLDDAIKPHDVKWQWVKGHAGHPGNERADELANEAIDAGAA